MDLFHHLSDRELPQRREFARFGAQCRARIMIGSRHYAGYLHNISQGGAQLRTISSIRRLGAVALRLPDLPPLHCRLCWTGTHNAGVQFEMALSARALHSWLRSRSTLITQVAELTEVEQWSPPARALFQGLAAPLAKAAS